MQPMQRPGDDRFALDAILTIAQLAEAIGPRRGNCPTHVETVRHWCLKGVKGVVLSSWLDVCTRRTTWGSYLAFRDAVATAPEEARQRRLAAIKPLSLREQKKRRRRHEEAVEKLKKLGAI